MRHLELLSGDVVGAGLSINNQGAVVGASITRGGPATGTPKAVLRRQGANGPVSNLNNYITGSPFDGGLLLTAYSISDSGEIAGFGLARDGEIHAFVALPCSENSPNCQNGAVPAATPTVKLTGDARRFFIQRGMRGR